MDKLYIDESGNTGEVLSRNNQFNFTTQPYYTLAGLLVNADIDSELREFSNRLKSHYRIGAVELKASSLYETKPGFIEELVTFIADRDVPVFVEIMDKVYYLNIQIVEYFLLPFHSNQITDSLIARKQFIVSHIGRFLNSACYQFVVDAVKSYSNESLELCYEQLIIHFENHNSAESKLLKSSVEQTRLDYLRIKLRDPQKALKKFLPIPDKNPKDRLIHLLPNYPAFTSLLARAEKYRVNNNLSPLYIIHDEQKQFGNIFESAFQEMKKLDTTKLLENSKISAITQYNISPQTTLSFQDSSSDILLQVADILSGFVMRFWADFMKSNFARTDVYLTSFKRLIYPRDNSSEGINFVVPDFDHYRLINYNRYRQR